MTGGDCELNILKEIDEHADVVVPEAHLRDLPLWPHLHGEDLMGWMFPTAVAAPEVESIDPDSHDELGKSHRRWAAVKIGITRG